jgi:hypothetical protein
VAFSCNLLLSVENSKIRNEVKERKWPALLSKSTGVSITKPRTQFVAITSPVLILVEHIVLAKEVHKARTEYMEQRACSDKMHCQTLYKYFTFNDT